jgi:hypothetical protein
MSHITIPAHYDGERIQLDEPIAIPRNASLLVTILKDDKDEERDDWYQLSLAGLARAYGNDEPEYSDADIKVMNPDYDGG